MSSNEKAQLDKDKLKEKLEEKFDLSHFDPNTVIRGAQLTLVGGEYHPPYGIMPFALH